MSYAQILADRREDDALVRYLTRGHRSQVIRLHGRPSPECEPAAGSEAGSWLGRLLMVALSALRRLVAGLRD